MKKVIAVVVCLLSACSADRPDDEELIDALAGLTQKKACITSTLFNQWPAQGRSVTQNKEIMERLSDVGLVNRANNSFDLTPKGKEYFDKEESGFCYASSHSVSDVIFIKELPKEQLPAAVYRAWQISFKIAPMVTGEWIDNEALLKLLKVEFQAITQPRDFVVRLIKRDENSEIELSDPRFSFSPHLHFQMGWVL
ncbi:MAG: hypothetical protein K2W88_09390 [Pararheinheimera sp.]|jgi:predicted transcriptional regulator|nr:hypothetical protein [Rheinheimera sp.]